MEGQFYRKNKTAKHPHTNMAKASLNMMVRTAAADYAKSNIYMNAVDTGWITGAYIQCTLGLPSINNGLDSNARLVRLYAAMPNSVYSVVK
jgi:NAD(P)-dependent dehydrogenase (short-subunit alcohol dehydrogenase family)